MGLFKNTVYELWIKDTYGLILIKNILGYKKKINISDLTFREYAFNDVLNQAESILCTELTTKDLDLIYTFPSDMEKNTEVKGYALSVATAGGQDGILQDESYGKFINYRNFDDYVRYYTYDHDFLESYTALLTYMDDIYGV